MNTDIVAASALRITCPKSALGSSLAVVSRAVSTRGAVQVLGGILLHAEGERLTLAATDMEISIRASLDGEIEGDASVVVPGRLLTDLVRLLPEDTVTLAYDEGEGVLAVTSGSHASRLNVYSAEDFPRLPPLDIPLQKIDSAALLSTIEKVGRAASRDESRPVLTGVLVRFEGDKLVMAATDSYRLAVKETVLSASGPELDAIIPARALQELARLAAGVEEIELGVHENHIVFSAGDVWLTSRRIDGQFPNYKQLLPESFEVEIATPREALLEVVRRAGLMAQRNAPLRLRFAEGELTVSAQTQDVGEATESLPIEYAGEELEIGFNPDFLRDGLEAVSGETVQLKLINRLRPGLIEAPGESFWYLIMPIRLAG
ncbi:MAG TPA: DNA polymerase III subunit beta [Gaiellaceae bacterium]|jgi:DNA polymerase-3 subunit beta|nr:DNA polymerase III subunit beta [Gaiellaceae bacterium]